MCSAAFEDVDELARHKRSHGEGKMKEMAAEPDIQGEDNRGPLESLENNLGTTAPSTLDDSTEESRSERTLTEAQRNDRANALANRAKIGDYRDDSEWEVNPNQTPRQTKSIRPIDYV